MKHFLPLLVIGLLGFTALLLVLTGGHTGQKEAFEQSEGASTGEAQVGGDFTLTDQNGNIVHDADFRGRFMLVFFGYTRCPDICPVTVANMSKTMGLLGGKADQVAPLFITLDPEHDTPAVLKDFLANFDARLRGLTGSAAQVKQAAEAYKVYSSHEPGGAGRPDYTVDHSAYIYMMGRDGKFLRIFPYTISSQELAHAVEHYLH